jgi:o-succinylbenzoate synthase
MKLELRRVTVATPRAQDARRAWPERQSLLVRFTDAQGITGTGEASPLPGYSRDSLSDVEPALAGISAAAFAEASSAPSVRDALGAVAALLPASLPSARMALETSALDFLSRKSGVPAPRLLGASSDAARPLAELVGLAASPTLVTDCERALGAGFRHLKLKLGAPGKLAEEVRAVVALRERCGSDIRLRLDANGALSASELEIAWPKLEPARIEFFEEPCQLSDVLPSALPLALDESLQGLDESAVTSLLERARASVIVLKPMALGGLAHCLELVTRARAVGKSAVISHCFDGPFAWRAAAALALALPNDLAHGLAPHAGLSAWPLGALPVTAGSLYCWQEPGLGLASEQGFT